MDKLAELEKELLADMEENPVEYKETVSNVFEIDSNLRTINIPITVKNIGVESDDDVKRLEFTMPKQYGEFDLSQFRIRINYMNANGDKSIYLVEDKKVSGENIVFSWLVGRNVTKYKGQVSFIICLKLSDEKGKILKELNTTLCKLEVLEGLEVVPVIDEKTTDIIEQLLRMVETETTGTVQKVTEEGKKQVAEVQKAAQGITADREQINANKTDITEMYKNEDFNIVKLENGLDIAKIKKGYYLNQDTGAEEAGENQILFLRYVKIKPDSDYSAWENRTTGKMEAMDVSTTNLRVCFYDSLKRILKSNSDENVFHSPQDARYARISMNQYFAGYSIFKEGTEKPENIIIPFTEELSLNEKVHIQKVEEAEKKIEENAKNLKSVTLNEEITGTGNIVTKPSVNFPVLDFTIKGKTELSHTDATPDKIATLTEFEDLIITVNGKMHQFLNVNANGQNEIFDEIKAGKIIRRFAKIILNGNENVVHSTSFNGQSLFSFTAGNYKLKQQGVAMCTHYTGALYYKKIMTCISRTKQILSFVIIVLKQKMRLKII
mgnify:CR=1 FL=1